MAYYTTLFAILFYSVGYAQNSVQTRVTELSDANQFINNSVTNHCDTTPGDHVTTNITVNTAKLEWDAQPNASSYIIEGGAVGGNPIIINRPATNDTIEVYPVSGLSMGNSYYWRIKAILCDSIEGNWSPGDTFTVPICETPTNLTTTIHPNKSVTISWDAMPVAIGYLIRGGTAPQPSSSEVQFINEAAKTFIVTGSLPPGTYSWKVLTGCDISPLVLSPFSQYSTFTIPGASQKHHLQSKGQLVSIYPNPANQFCSIMVDDLLCYKIYSQNGTEVLAGSEYQIALSDLPAGVYHVVIHTESEIFSERLLITR
ncbi:MAG: T9SS type A sorting domain-containing protein [Chitinophagales bacterium]|nr:T9SS type A sorting domain-containing protein [Chitinophagales bacterium]